MKLSLNGEHREFPDSITVADMLGILELTGKRVAIERNGEIVPRSQHADTRLADGDVLEMVVAVGGG
ncbi:sulfur carrier protein ThiS [Chitinilyticum litopenaei]|uniref:sulfur carrier protein ThiS n=1 Tax=Chitinilyticum litopenaei TaxID=1121276 RepID=UPI00041A680D|nr:sulfur carrier protein ThiS [Chitinilyticum litopenaei]